MKKKAIIFDMDGLMIDSEIVSYKGFKEILGQKDLTIDDIFYKTMLGNNRPTIVGKLKSYYGENFDAEELIDEVHVFMANYFKTKGVSLKKGLIEILEYTKENGYKTIVATSSDRNRVDILLKQANITHYFDDSITGDEVENGKPNPEIFLKSCEKLGVTTDEAFVLEDSEMGILAAYKSSIDCICVPDMIQPATEFAEKTYKVVESLLDVIDILKEIDK